MTNVTILNTHTVKPAGEATQKDPLHMTAWDHIFGVAHVMTVHFYRHNPEYVYSPSQISSLKDSLGRALAHFSPFAGRLRQDDTGRMEIDCNSMGAVLVEAVCDEDLSYVAELPSDQLKGLVAAVDYEKEVHEVPLLLVQLTTLRCGGVALGIAWAHAVADGQSAFHFFHEWARLARGEPLKEVPNVDRRVFIRDRKSQQPITSSDHVELSALPLLLGRRNGSEERNKETINMMLPVTKAQLDALKKVADGHGVSPAYTRYQVVAGHIWRCACKARGLDNEQPTTISIAVDVRNRIVNDPIPPRYFGNAFLIMRAASKAGELVSSPLGSACSKIREAIRKVDEDYIWSHIEVLESKEDLNSCSQDIRASKPTSDDIPFAGNPNLGVISWFTLPLYGLDFGWGDAANVRQVTRDLDGDTLLLPLPNSDGSIVVYLCFQRAHADEFKKYFYDDIHKAVSFVGQYELFAYQA